MPSKSRKVSQDHADLIASFLGVPAEELATPPPDSMSDLIGRVQSEISSAQPSQSHTPGIEQIRAVWAEVVGPMLARNCTPEKIDEHGRLMVRCSSGHIKRTFSSELKRVTERLNSKLQDQVLISHIHLR